GAQLLDRAVVLAQPALRPPAQPSDPGPGPGDRETRRRPDPSATV
ncbi:MAG: hypothetical protein AVDCRST_MAG33-3402, partial [uncultured Thermomicrobiales bacterium]